MKVKSESEVTQSCPTLCDPMDCSLQGSSIHGIFQGLAILEGLLWPSSSKRQDLPLNRTMEGITGAKMGQNIEVAKRKMQVPRQDTQEVSGRTAHSSQDLHPSLPGLGQGEPCGLPSMGSHRVGHD